MDSQGVEVLHVTYGDTVIVFIAYYFVLNFLPSLQRFLNQHLWREGKGFLGQLVELLFVVAETRTQTAECVCCTQDNWIAQCLSGLTCALDIRASLALDGLYANLVELLYKQLAVLGIHDSLYRCTQYLYAILLQYAALVKLNTAVQSSLTTECQQDAIGALLLDYSLYEIRLNRQEVNLVGYTL